MTPPARQPAAIHWTTMEPISEALRLLKRQAAIQNELRRSHGTSVLDERECDLIRNKLALYPAAVQAITLAAPELRRPIDTLSLRDLETRC